MMWCWLVFAWIAVVAGQSMYRYDVIIDYLEKPNQRDSMFDYRDLRVKKYNRTTFVVDGSIEILQPFSDDFIGSFELYSYYGNEYKLLYQKNITAMCSYLKNDDVIFGKIINSTSLAPRIKKCPIDKGIYYAYNLKFPSDQLPVEPTMFRKGKANIRYFLDGEPESTLTVYFMIERINPFI